MYILKKTKSSTPWWREPTAALLGAELGREPREAGVHPSDREGLGGLFITMPGLSGLRVGDRGPKSAFANFPVPGSPREGVAWEWGFGFK